MVGQLKFIALGPMFSGKSTYLIHEINRAMFAGRSCLIIKYAGDTRYDEHQVVTHDFMKPNMAADTFSIVHKCVSLMDEPELIEKLQTVQVVAIDEAQFFPDIYEFVQTLLYQHNKIVYIASLDSWHNLEPCMSVIRLVPYAEHIVKLMAVCGICKSENATRTYKAVAKPKTTAATQTQSDIDLIEVGGASMYSALCLSCYNCACSQ